MRSKNNAYSTLVDAVVNGTDFVPNRPFLEDTFWRKITANVFGGKYGERVKVMIGELDYEPPQRACCEAMVRKHLEFARDYRDMLTAGYAKLRAGEIPTGHLSSFVEGLVLLERRYEDFLEIYPEFRQQFIH